MNKKPQRPRDQSSWDRRYIEGDLPWDSGNPDPHLSRVIDEHGIRPGKGFEIGCGTGTNSIWLAERGFEMTGLDLSPTAIEMAEARAAAAEVNCRLRVGNILVDEVPGAPFEFAYDRGCLHVFDSSDDRSRFASRVADVLAPEGMWHSLIGSTDGPPRDSGPPRRSATEIVAAVEPYFEILELRSTTFAQGEHRDARAWVLVARRRTRT